MREICTSGLKRGAEPRGSAPTRLKNLLFLFSWCPAAADLRLGGKELFSCLQAARPLSSVAYAVHAAPGAVERARQTGSSGTALPPRLLRFGHSSFSVVRLRSSRYTHGMLLIDTHAHLDEEAFRPDRNDVIARARETGLECVVTIGTTAASSREAVEIARADSLLFAAVGIQPNYVAEAAPGDWEVIEELATRPRVVAIGETGLDRYWDHAPFDLQAEYFGKHIALRSGTSSPSWSIAARRRKTSSPRSSRRPRRAARWRDALVFRRRRDGARLRRAGALHLVCRHGDV